MGIGYKFNQTGKAAFDGPDRAERFARIYDQVSLRDHVKSDCIQRRYQRINPVVDNRIFLPQMTKFK